MEAWNKEKFTEIFFYKVSSIHDNIFKKLTLYFGLILDSLKCSNSKDGITQSSYVTRHPVSHNVNLHISVMFVITGKLTSVNYTI